MKKKIENLVGFEKDMTMGGRGSGALLNADLEALEQYKKTKNHYARLDALEQDITCVKNDLAEILKLLKGN